MISPHQWSGSLERTKVDYVPPSIRVGFGFPQHPNFSPRKLELKKIKKNFHTSRSLWLSLSWNQSWNGSRWIVFHLPSESALGSRSPPQPQIFSKSLKWFYGQISWSSRMFCIYTWFLYILFIYTLSRGRERERERERREDIMRLTTFWPLKFFKRILEAEGTHHKQLSCPSEL